jgi:saccharopine dehydrogenase-like NADP-dependent oxidoreductase
MNKRVLILGGRGRIGSNVAADILAHTDAMVTITGRTAINQANLGERTEFLVLDLAEVDKLQGVIAASDLVIHCAGPFHFRDANVLQLCIAAGVNYLDVSDHRSFTTKALEYHDAAMDAGVTAIVNTGIFPGISNNMVRHDVEQFDSAEKIHLSYLVAGSGGAGITVMRTTFLGLQNPFTAWIDGRWQTVKPYTARENVDFSTPSNQSVGGVYWFDMPETLTLPTAFPTVKSVITKFGSVPDYYNHLTWIAAHIFPKFWIQSQMGVEFLSSVSYQMTQFTDQFSGIGVVVRSHVTGNKDGKQRAYCSTLTHNNTAVAAGAGTGTIAQLLLTGNLHQPGVHTTESALPTALFQQAMLSRGIEITSHWT